MLDPERLMRMLDDPNSNPAWKLDALLDLERLDDVRVVPFLLKVLAQSVQPTSVRIAVLRGVTERSLAPQERIAVALELVAVVEDRLQGETHLRDQACIALADFTDSAAAVQCLGAIARDSSEVFELRYSAFTSLQRAGPTAECLQILADLCGDETLGSAAEGVLRRWRGQ